MQEEEEEEEEEDKEEEEEEDKEEERPNRCTIGGGLSGLQQHPANQFEAGSCPVASFLLSCTQVSTTKLLEVEEKMERGRWWWEGEGAG